MFKVLSGENTFFLECKIFLGILKTDIYVFRMFSQIWRLALSYWVTYKISEAMK